MPVGVSAVGVALAGHHAEGKIPRSRCCGRCHELATKCRVRLAIHARGLAFVVMVRPLLQPVQGKLVNEVGCFRDVHPIRCLGIAQIHLGSVAETHPTRCARAGALQLPDRHIRFRKLLRRVILRPSRNQIPLVVADRGCADACPDDRTSIGDLADAGAHRLMKFESSSLSSSGFRQTCACGERTGALRDEGPTGNRREWSFHGTSQ